MYGNFYSKIARESFRKAMMEEEKERKYKPRKRIKLNPDKIAIQNSSGWLSSDQKQEIIDELNKLLELAEVRLSEVISLKGDSESIRGTGYNAFFAMARDGVFKKYGITGSNKLEVIYSEVLGNVMGINKHI